MTTHRHFTDEELAAWCRDGFIVVRGLLGAAEIADVTRWADVLQAWPETPGKHMKYFDGSLAEPGARLLNRIENFCPFHEGFDRLINGDAFIELHQHIGNLAIAISDQHIFHFHGFNHRQLFSSLKVLPSFYQ